MYDLNRPWQQTTDLEPVDLPEAGPLDAPQVCIQINASWLPVVMGALCQLALPAQWNGDDAAQQLAVTASTQLLLAVGAAEVCPVLEFRFTAGCVLQVSLDGGTTWADVPGWDTFAPGCFTGPTGPEGPAGPVPPPVPPNPQGSATAVEACNIASYLTQLVIKASVNQQVNAINAAATILDAALGLAALIPGIGLVFDLALAGAYALNSIIASTGTSAFTTALADAALWSEVQCAIYLAIKAVGYVDASNYAAVGTALEAVVYSDDDVTDAIAAYWTSLTLQGVQAAQSAGSLYLGDCSACEFTPGCATMIATTVGSGSTYDDTPLGGGTFTSTAADLTYVGVVGAAPNYAHPYQIKAHVAGSWGAVGWYEPPLLHGGPSAGDNLWVNSVSAYGLLTSDGAWYVVGNGSVLGSGSVTFGAGNIQMNFYPGAGSTSMQFYINGVNVWIGAYPDESYLPIAILVHTGDAVTDVQVCQVT